jgi:hypothetical protein
MSQLQSLQFPIDQSIFGEVLESIPPTWSRARLDVKLQGGSADNIVLNVRIDSLGQPGAATPTDALHEKVRELFLLNERFKTDLRGISYSYERTPSGKWSFAGDYDYAP